MKRLSGKMIAILLAAAMWLTPSMSSLPVYAEEELSTELTTADENVDGDDFIEVDVLESDEEPDTFSANDPAQDIEADLNSEEDDFSWTINDEEKGSVSITGFNSETEASGSLTIPSQITDGEGTSHNVTAIGANAFQDCSGLTGELMIPDSVTVIDDYAFDGCSGFTSVTFGSGLTSIGEGAFYVCSGLTGDLELPEDLTTIGEDAFAYCRGLNGTLTIPTSVTTIGEDAFYGTEFATITNNSGVKIDCSEIRQNYSDEDNWFAYVKNGTNTKASQIEKGTYKYMFALGIKYTFPQNGGSIDVSGVNDDKSYYYAFTTESSGKYLITISNSSCDLYDVDVSIYDGNGDYIDSDYDYDNGEKIYSAGLEEGETYYIEAGASTEGNSSFTMTVSKDEGWTTICSQAVELTDETRNVVIQPDEDKWYKYTPASTGNYFIYSTSKDSNSDSVVYLYDRNGNRLTNSDDNGDYYNFFIERKLTKDSVYYLRCGSCYEVKGEDGEYVSAADSYTLHVDPVLTYINGKNPQNIAVNGSVTVKPEPKDRRKWLKFTPEKENGAYSFYINGSDDADIELYDTEGYIVENDETGLSIKHFSGGITVKNPVKKKDYYVMVRSYAYKAEDITVIVVDPDEYANTIKNAPVITAEPSDTKVELTSSVQEKYYKFTATTPGRYVLYAKGGSKPCVSMLNVDGASVSVDSTEYGTGGDDNHVEVLHDFWFSTDEEVENKTFYFKAFSKEATDTFHLAVVPWSSFVSLIASEIGENGVDGAITKYEEEGDQWFWFKPTTTEEYNIYSEGGKGLYAELYDSDGNEMCGSGSNDGDFVAGDKLNEGKVYYLRVYSYYKDDDGNTNENFTVKAIKRKVIADPIKEKSISIPVEGSVKIEYKGDPVYCRFEPKEPGVYVIHAWGGKKAGSPYFQLLDSNFVTYYERDWRGSVEQYITYSGEDGEYGTSTTTPGTYYFKAYSSEGEDTFNLSIERKWTYIRNAAINVPAGGSAEIKRRHHQYYSFTPKVTGSYTVYSEMTEEDIVDQYYNPHFYSGDGTELKLGKIERVGWVDFTVTATFEAGKTYYLDITQQISGKGILHFVQNSASLSGAVVTPASSVYTYTGSAIKPDVTVKLGGTVLSKGTDYTISYSNNINVGTATITVTGVGKYTGTAKATFTIAKAADPKPQSKPVTGIKLNKDKAYLKVKKTLQLKAAVTPADATDKSVVWSTDNPEVATVSASGLVTAKEAGTAVITATTSNGKTAKCKIKVPGMTLNDTKLTVMKGKTSSKIKVKLIHDSIESVKSSKPSVASVKVSGKKLKIKGLKKGSSNVTVTSKNGLTAKLKVTVQEDKVTTQKLKLSKTKVKIKKGAKTTVKATATPDRLSTGETIKVTSSNKKIAKASIDKNTGIITIQGMKKGSCDVIVSVGDLTKTISVTVKKK